MDHIKKFAAKDGFFVLIFSILLFGALGTLAVLGLRLLVTNTSLNSFLDSHQMVINVASYALILFSEIFALWLLVIRRFKLKLRDLGFRKFNTLSAILYIAGFYGLLLVTIMVVFAIVGVLAPEVNLDEKQNIFQFGRSTPGLLLSFIASVVIAPVVEEIYFRGFLFRAFSNSWGVAVGALASSMIFGLLHFQANVVIFTIILGLFLSLMYHKLNSIWPPILLHFANNLIAFMILLKS